MEVDRMLREEVGNESWKNYIVLLLDEIKVWCVIKTAVK